uniref:Uncharacterized protein n=1 Tax=Aegilops tauschii subsp. strangulata TaxID=200361 RepID=A0A452ZH81_AEGTS
AIVPYNDSRDSQTETDNMDVEEDNIDVNLNSSPREDFDDSFWSDIFDPRNWDSLNSKQIDILAQKGPKADKLVKGPKDRYRKRFTSVFYTRILSNGEYFDRDWLVYSEQLDRVFCFGCKLFTKGHRKGHSRLEKHQTIDKAAQRQLEKEKDHWRKVLFRIVCIVKFLAKHNLAFCGTNGKLYEDSNGNFLGLVEMLAEFDPVIQEHVRRITNEETHAHYLDHKIQNELLHLLASAIRKWHILKENVSGLTLKSVSAMRWESRVESVKAIRFQCSDIREALL